MKKITFLLLTTFFAFNPVFSQVVYSDDFENYTLGNLGTDPDDQVSGQGGWFTKVARIPKVPPTSIDNALFTIVNEPGRGKVLMISSPNPPVNEGMVARKINLEPLIDTRTAGNNVLKFEIDYYTGSQHNFYNNNTATPNIIHLYKNTTSYLQKDRLVSIHFLPQSGGANTRYSRGNGTEAFVILDNSTSTLPFNTWIKLMVYLDYVNKKIYFETPYFGTVQKGDFLDLSTSTNLLEDFKPSVLRLAISTTNHIVSTHQMISKYDNIKITALKEVPAYIVSANSFLNEQFTIFPNPASSFVNITNALNLEVEEVSIYDLSGKLLKTQKVVSAENIQLNIEEFAVGTYLFHIKTKEGTAVKKIIKK